MGTASSARATPLSVPAPEPATTGRVLPTLRSRARRSPAWWSSVQLSRRRRPPPPGPGYYAMPDNPDLADNAGRAGAARRDGIGGAVADVPESGTHELLLARVGYGWALGVTVDQNFEVSTPQAGTL